VDTLCLSAGRNEFELIADFEKLSQEAQARIEEFYNLDATMG
jgi:hypothetical protein